jgi:NAD(P)-dependent dehydrogenase (short-subunit alcohol dehydrogenase family)/acyl carrier protein
VHGVFGRGQSWDAPVTSASVRVLDGDGRVIADVDDVRFQKVSRQALFGAAFKSWLYEIEWRPAERSEAARPRTAGRWLVLGGAALGVRVAAAVTARGAACATDASVLDDGEPLAGVLDLRALDVPNAVPPLDAAADSCARVLSLVQTLARGARRSPPRLWIATRGATAAPPHAGLPGLADATLWGMGRAVALEHPELRCSLIDLDPAGDGLDVDGLLDAVLADAAEPAVALRGADRLVARLARSAAAPADGDARFRGDSTYLVTGGLTGLGLEVADWMAGLGAGRLVLVGRRAPDAAARARIARMSARGAQVIVRQADAADRDQLTQVLAEIDASAAPLAGVFHLAGVFDDGIAIQQTRERFERVLRPKVQGGWLLHELTIDRPLDHFVLFSSAVSILGNAGQSNYAAANAFLDALATHRRARGLAALSLDWGPWAEIGAAAELVPRTGGPGARAMRALRPAEGLQVLGQILSAPAPQIAILPIEWPALDAAAAPPLLADFARQVPAREMRDAFVNDRWAAAPPALRRELLVGHVCALACAVMGLPAGTTIDPDEGFFDLGFDSLMSVQLRNRLQTSLGCSLSATLAFDHPTPAALADYLLLDALRPAADAVDAAPAGVGDDELRAVLDGVEQLSDEEALAALRQQGRAW